MGSVARSIVHHGRVPFTAVLLLTLLGAVVVPAQAGTSRAGRLDPSFGGGDGTVAVPRTSAVSRTTGESLVGLFARPNGTFRTVTTGYGAMVGPAYPGNQPGYITVRGFRADGTVDPAFNHGTARVLRGVILSSVPIESTVEGAAMDSAGRIVIAVSTSNWLNCHPCQVRLYRILADGRVDTAYHPVWQRPSNFVGYLARLAVLPDGRARLCIGDDVADPVQPAVIRVYGYTASGHTERTFGTGQQVGLAVLPTTAAHCRVVTSDAAGRVLITSYVYRDVVRVTRLTARGRLETAFGSHGTTTVRNWGRMLLPAGITVARDGSIYVAGTSLAYLGPTAGTAAGEGIFVTRLYGSGAPATRFGLRGVVIATVPAARPDSWDSTRLALADVSVDTAKRVYLPLGAADSDARHGVRPGWLRINGYTGARDATWGTRGFLGLPSSSRADQRAGRVLTLSSSKLLAGATLVVSGTATGAVIQRRYSS